MATLKVTVHEARDLPIMDRTTGLADPYVVVKLDDMEHTTDIARRTRNPVWEHDVRFDTADLLVLQEDPLEVRVYDHDIISRDDIVGIVLLDCNSIIYRDNPAVSGWFPLIDSDAGLHGDIRLTIRIKFHAAENPLAPALPERYVRRLDPRVAMPSPPTTPQAASNTANAVDMSTSLSALPSVVLNSAGGDANWMGSTQQTSTSTLDPITLSLRNVGAANQQNNNSISTAANNAVAAAAAAAAAAAGGSLRSPPSKVHSTSASRHASVLQSSPAGLYHADCSSAGANGASAANLAGSINPGPSASVSMSPYPDMTSPAHFSSSSLLPFLMEQDLDPLQAARVDHPTLAAEEEGVFVFSVWRLDPAVFRVESTHSMMEELIVKADPEHVRFTNLRSSRSINDARVIQLFKLSGKVRRQLARKVVELQCNAVLGYVEEFDMEPNGIIVRAYGTPCVVSKVKYVDEREMQRVLRSKTRYLGSNIAAAYQSELAQQLQCSPLSLSHIASPLMGGNALANASASLNPTYFPSPSSILPRGGGLAGPATPPVPSATYAGSTGSPPASVASRDHLLPPAVGAMSNDFMAAAAAVAQMPPETTSTAMQSPATTPASQASAAAAQPYREPPALSLDDHSGSPPGAEMVSPPTPLQSSQAQTVAGATGAASLTSSPSFNRSGCGASVGNLAAVPPDVHSPYALVAAVVSASAAGTPPYVGSASELAAMASSVLVAQSPQQQQQQSSGQISAARGGQSEGGAAPLSPSAATVAPTAMPPAAALGATTANGANAAAGAGASSRVMISMLTVKDLPAGAIHHIGGYICARSVKIVSRVKSRQMISQERDAWWMELREELRANARAFHCNTVLGYEEETQYHEDVVLLSLYGTAVMLDMSVTSMRAGPEHLFRRQRQRVAVKRNCTLLHLYEGPRRRNGQQSFGLLAGDVGDLLLHHVCSVCHNKPVPEVLLAACTLPVELSCEAPPRLVQVAVSKTKPNVKGVELAMAVSQALPFIEFALHKQLLFNLRLQQMNACFALRVSVVVGPDAIIGTLTGSGCRLAGLPVPRLPRITVVDPLIANKESVVKLRDVIASRHRRRYSYNHSSSSSSSSSSRSTSSTSSSSGSSSASSSTSSSRTSVSGGRLQARGAERSASAVRTGFTDDARAAASAPMNGGSITQSAFTPNSVSSPTSATTSGHRQQRGQQQQPQQRAQQQQKSKRHRRSHRSRHRKSSKRMSGRGDGEDGSASASSAAAASADSTSSDSSAPTSSAGASLSSDVRGRKPKEHRSQQRRQQKERRRRRRRRARRLRASNPESHTISLAAVDNAAGPSRSASRSHSTSSTDSSSTSSSSHSSSSTSSSRSSRRSSRDGSSSLDSWVPTEASESDEDVYAPADDWHASSSGVRTKTSDYVVKIDDMEEADMMLGMVDSTNFEDGVLLTLPYVPDSANAFDWQERIVLDRRYSRAAAPSFVGGSALNNGSINVVAGSYAAMRGSMSSAAALGNSGSRGDAGQGSMSGGVDGGAGQSGTTASAPGVAAAGRLTLTTRLLNEYCADAKRAFVHRACRMAMLAHQPLRLRVVNLRVEMMFVPNSADLQLRLEGCVMIASSAGARQLGILEDRAFRVCMHHTLESLSGLWHYHHQQQQQQQQQQHSQASHSNAGGGGGGGGSSSAPHRSAGTPLVSAANANGSGRVTPAVPWGPNTPVLSPMLSGEGTNNNASSAPQQQQQQHLHSSNGLRHLSAAAAVAAAAAVTAAAAGGKASSGTLLPLIESGPAYLDARRLFLTCNAPFSLPYVQDITLPPPRVWSGVATAFSEDTAAPPRHTSTYTEYRDNRGSRTTSLTRRWHAFVRATGQSIKGLVDRATGGTGDRIDRRLQQQRRWLSSTADGNSMTVAPDGAAANNSADPSMMGLRDANYSHPAARLPQDMSQLQQLIPVVLFTPLDYVAGRSIVRYLGRLSQHFIREDYDTDTGDDLNVFFQRAEMEIMCMVQSVVRLMGGNALLKHRIVYHEICDSDGSGSAFLFATVTGDVVQVSAVEYHGTSSRDGTAKRRHHRYGGNREEEEGGSSGDEEGVSTPRNRARGEEAPDDSNDESSRNGAAAKRRKSRRGTSRRRSTRRRRSRERRHRRRHHRSSSTTSRDSRSRSSSSSTSSHTVSSSTTADSATPTPSQSSSFSVRTPVADARVRLDRVGAGEDPRWVGRALSAQSRDAAAAEAERRADTREPLDGPPHAR